MEDLIYCQKEIPKEQWRYGLRPSADTGCGWIAVHNVLRLLDRPSDPETLIRDFTRQLPLIHGNLGTTILAPALYLRKLGFETDWTAREDRFDAFAKEYPVCILFYRWYGKLRIGAHFAAFRSTEDGFVGYNTFTGSKGPDHYGKSLQAFCKRQKFFGCVVIGIRPKGGETL